MFIECLLYTGYSLSVGGIADTIVKSKNKIVNNNKKKF